MKEHIKYLDAYAHDLFSPSYEAAGSPFEGECTIM